MLRSNDVVNFSGRVSARVTKALRSVSGKQVADSSSGPVRNGEMATRSSPGTAPAAEETRIDAILTVG